MCILPSIDLTATGNLRLMKAMLHQLSYGGMESCQPELNRQPAARRYRNNPVLGRCRPDSDALAARLTIGLDPRGGFLQDHRARGTHLNFEIVKDHRVQSVAIFGFE